MRPALYWVVRVTSLDGDRASYVAWLGLASRRHAAVRVDSLAKARELRDLRWPGARVVRVVRSRRAEARERVIDAAKAYSACRTGQQTQGGQSAVEKDETHRALLAAVAALREVEK